MPNFSEPVSLAFVGSTVAVIFVIIAVGILAVKKFK